MTILLDDLSNKSNIILSNSFSLFFYDNNNNNNVNEILKLLK